MDEPLESRKTPSPQGRPSETPQEDLAALHPPAVLRIALVLGAVLGAWLALEGLYARLFGHMPELSTHFELWASLLIRWQLNPANLGWPLVVVGTTWWGSLAGVWIRHRWGWPFAMVLGLVSLIFLGPSTLIAACLLAILLLPGVRAWRAVA
ncbi:MAG: hypothetical protein ABSF61_10660 [Anaerolineales bacterium]|jgi:hypothetical protein